MDEQGCIAAVVFNQPSPRSAAKLAGTPLAPARSAMLANDGDDSLTERIAVSPIARTRALARNETGGAFRSKAPQQSENLAVLQDQVPLQLQIAGAPIYAYSASN